MPVTQMVKPHCFLWDLSSGAGLGEEVTCASQELPAAQQLTATRDLAQHPPPPSSGGWHRNGIVGLEGTAVAGMDTVRNHPSSLKEGKKGGRREDGR